jgi:hypothetical protein
MRQVCTRCIYALQPTIRTVGTRRLLSTTLARYGNEGTSPKAKALEVYQVPKSNIPGRTLLTQAGQDDLREKPKILLWLAMKLFRTRPIRKATQGSKTKGVMREYYALCATRATSDGDEASVGFWYDGIGSFLRVKLIYRTRSATQFRNLVPSHCPTRLHAARPSPLLRP